ncbi:MAG TPA: hypothetical protein PKA20_21025 [Burkholderiaceae bacterium]|nr:hypothetical protein [Burkholderiaceae bacterium]
MVNSEDEVVVSLPGKRIDVNVRWRTPAALNAWPPTPARGSAIDDSLGGAGHDRATVR